MKIPEQVNSSWIATLKDEQLVTAEAQLHTAFQRLEKKEKSRIGARYVLLQGPATLVNAWMRWSLVSNETRFRGLTVYHQAD